MKETKPSSTARFVTNGIWWAANNAKLGAEVPRHMKSYNEAITREVNPWYFRPRGLRGYFLKFKTSFMQRYALPGFYLHFVLRKRCIEQNVKKAVAAGAKQVVVVGAGFDTLGLSLAESCPDISILEIDHPATQKIKRQALTRQTRIPDNFSFVPADLTCIPLRDVLSQTTTYSEGQPAVFVIEGLTMYLDEKDVIGLLNCIKESSHSNSRIVFTYLQHNSRGQLQFEAGSKIIAFWLRLVKEEFKWGLCREHLSLFLDTCGFELLHHASHNDLRRDYLSASNHSALLAAGENIAVIQSA